MKKILLLTAMISLLIRCDQREVTNESEAETCQFNHTLNHSVLRDSLISFDKKMKKSFGSDVIIIMYISKTFNSDSLSIALTQILNLSEFTKNYPSYITEVEDTPVFMYTGFEKTVNMPLAWLEKIDLIRNEKLTPDIGEQRVPPTTYTPIIKEFLIFDN